MLHAIATINWVTESMEPLVFSVMVRPTYQIVIPLLLAITDISRKNIRFKMKQFRSVSLLTLPKICWSGELSYTHVIPLLYNFL